MLPLHDGGQKVALAAWSEVTPCSSSVDDEDPRVAAHSGSWGTEGGTPPPLCWVLGFWLHLDPAPPLPTDAPVPIASYRHALRHGNNSERTPSAWRCFTDDDIEEHGTQVCVCVRMGWRSAMHVCSSLKPPLNGRRRDHAPHPMTQVTATSRTATVHLGCPIAVHAVSFQCARPARAAGGQEPSSAPWVVEWSPDPEALGDTWTLVGSGRHLPSDGVVVVPCPTQSSTPCGRVRVSLRADPAEEGASEVEVAAATSTLPRVVAVSVLTQPPSGADTCPALLSATWIMLLSAGVLLVV
jgi:hypothetical protein